MACFTREIFYPVLGSYPVNLHLACSMAVFGAWWKPFLLLFLAHLSSCSLMVKYFPSCSQMFYLSFGS